MRLLLSNSLKASVFDEEIFKYHFSLLRSGNVDQVNGYHALAPIVASCAFAHSSGLDQATQFGLLAGLYDKLGNAKASIDDDPRIFSMSLLHRAHSYAVPRVQAKAIL